MTSRLTAGATMYSAPVRSAARAFSGSRLAPAPSSTRSRTACRTRRSTSRAFGTVIVLSVPLTPPPATAPTPSTSCWLSCERTTATMPQSRACLSCVSLLMGDTGGDQSVVAAARLDGPDGFHLAVADGRGLAVQVHRGAAVGGDHLAAVADL